MANTTDAMPAIEMQPCAPGERWERERQCAGFDEGEISAAIAQHWDFPANFEHALRHCARPLATPSNTLSVVLHQASRLADHPRPGGQALTDWPTSCVEALGLNLKSLAKQVPDAERLNDISALQAS